MHSFHTKLSFYSFCKGLIVLSQLNDCMTLNYPLFCNEYYGQHCSIWGISGELELNRDLLKCHDIVIKGGITLTLYCL